MFRNFVKYSIEQALLKTLAYADLFSWPLKEEEIQKYLIGKKIDKTVKLRTVLKRVVKSGKIEGYKSYYFLPGKKSLVRSRLQKEKWAKHKILLASKASRWLRIIPSILLVGVSGGLAVGSVDEGDDIDFFVLCKKGTLWTTRFLTALLLDILGVRRRPRNKDIKDKICLNMFVDELGMVVLEKERDLFTAHEVAQMKPLWERGVYKRFLEVNNWVEEYLPNAKGELIENSSFRVRKVGRNNFLAKLTSLFRVISKQRTVLKNIEQFLRWVQLKYMASKRTGEKIEAHRLLFHPKDKRRIILKKYKEKLRFLRITL